MDCLILTDAQWVRMEPFCLGKVTDMEYAMVDAAIVRVHRHGQGAKGRPNQAIGKSRGA